jgi:hypothetical protein
MGNVVDERRENAGKLNSAVAPNAAATHVAVRRTRSSICYGDVEVSATGHHRP